MKFYVAVNLILIYTTLTLNALSAFVFFIGLYKREFESKSQTLWFMIDKQGESRWVHRKITDWTNTCD